MDKLSSLSRVPTSILECIHPDTGMFDADLFELYRQRSRAKDSYKILQEIIDDDSDTDDENDDVDRTKSLRNKRQRRPKERREQRLYRCPIDGQIKVLGPKSTFWYTSYVQNPNPASVKFQRKFRRRFRMSYDSYVKHLAEVKESDCFNAWSSESEDCVGKKSSPIELLLLGTLRYLGRAWTLDDLEEQTMISEEVHRLFLHAYISWGSTSFYERYVVTPRDEDELQTNSREYEMAGLPGCIGSQDATHIGMLRCQYRLRQYHNSYKLPMPTRTYNLTVNHRRRILSSTRGHPGRWNDKTLVLYDSLSTDLRDGRRYANNEFELLETDPVTGNIRKVRYVGVWLVVDNGYLSWSTLIPPITSPATWQEFRFSKWIESMRKDVECTFGILKCRFAVLKRGITLHGIDSTDRIWLTCCALHNFLLEEDGLDLNWDGNLEMELFGDGGRGNDEADVSGLGNDAIVVGNDDSIAGSNFHEDTIHETPTMPEPTTAEPNNDPIKVWKLSRAQFRDRLVENFHIRWTRKEVAWPTRTGLDRPNVD
jgi:hypothetical protein